jgi:hypothetical protein
MSLQVQETPAARKLAVRNGGYGLEYTPGEDNDVSSLGSVEEANRIRSKSRESFNQRLAAIEAPDDPSSDEEEFQGTPPSAEPEEEAPEVVRPSTERGACESVFLWMKSAQPYLIAMCQGLMAMPLDKYPSYYVFDMDVDETLKNFPQKALFFPNVKVLKEEASRRATALKLKPLKKSATRVQLLDWLKINAVTDPVDEAFLRREAGKTYAMILKQEEEAASVDRTRQTAKNWSTADPWLRFYHCVTDDEVKTLLRQHARVLSRTELDGRNSTERPPTIYEAVARLYNSDKMYVSYSLPDLHSSFADSQVLSFDEMPGGAITAEDAKARLGDARAKMISIIADCEQSGNGFGQRDMADDSFGVFDPEYDTQRGDERASFVKTHLGQRFHHLYFWHLCDTMGVLKTVLNVLSPEVAVDCENVAADTTSTLRRRSRTPSDDEEERSAKKKFREGVQLSLKSIGDGMKEGNLIQAIVTTRAAIRAEEDKVMSLKIKLITCTPEENEIFAAIVDHHQGRIHEYDEELASLIKKRDHLGKR